MKMKGKNIPYNSMGVSSRSICTRPQSHFKFFFVFLFSLLLFGIAAFLLPQISNLLKTDYYQTLQLNLDALDSLPEVTVSSGVRATPTLRNCTYYTCFDVYHCSHTHNGKIAIYVYPLVEYVDEEQVPVSKKITQEFYDLLRSVVDSEYYTARPEEACIFVPSVDLLNQNRVEVLAVGKALASLQHWNEGKNHLLFNMLPGGPPEYSPSLEVSTGQAVIAGGGFSLRTHRLGFDVSIPVFSPLAKMSENSTVPRKWFIISSQTNIHSEFREDITELAAEHPDFLVLDRCWSFPDNMTIRCRNEETYQYPDILLAGTFCIVLRAARLGQPSLAESLAAGCIPVVIADSYVLPFSDVLDWKRAVIQIYEENMPLLPEILRNVSSRRVDEMRETGQYFYVKYFSSMKNIALTTLRILNDRVFPHHASSYEDWNDPPETRRAKNPLLLPMGPPRSQGFTAVVLTYDRLDSLFQVLERISKAPSLAKILVVWNNQRKAPPPASAWPRLPKPLQVVRTKQNHLSNRFYPFSEIETDAILAMDDDIVMLTTDELEFGFEVWRQFPDRIVGFPSRTHVWDNATSRWKYESEWTNDVSMVLTGAAFYHRYYNYLYTTSMPGDIKTWVDEHMNCEDIAMNFLVANLTGKAPIKVAPRKKFRCPECTNMEMLSVDASHMVERSECINRFAQIYGVLPLQRVEFRADPVLYKDNVPDSLKKFKDLGNL